MLPGESSSVMAVLPEAQAQAEHGKTFTMNNCLITKVYYRRRYKIRKPTTEERDSP
jgi:hypothetical protein